MTNCKKYGISKTSTIIINRITIIKPNESVDFIKIYAFICYAWKFETEQGFKKSKKSYTFSCSFSINCEKQIIEIIESKELVKKFEEETHSFIDPVKQLKHEER